MSNDAQGTDAPPEEPTTQDNAETDQVGILEPPTTIRGVVRHLGPGLIIAGSIVGSGELIATTKTGAQAGFSLLWLILLGCIIKVFVQVELGRYTLINGKTTMQGMVEVPGPRIGKGNWLVWAWFLMFLFSLAQLGGIVGGVGQALAISAPITDGGVEYNKHVSLLTKEKVKVKEVELVSRLVASGDSDPVRLESLRAELSDLNTRVAEADLLLRRDLGEERYNELGGKPPVSPDAKLWATLVTVVTIVMLVYGKYGLIQSFSTAMVGLFTFITVYNLFRLQGNPEWAVTFEDIKYGFSLALPEREGAIATALATFGIIGVGASELVAYPYWCLEKGYAKFTGPREMTPEWERRARGWMRVMQWDAWASMVVYTFATIAFFLLGAAILGRTELDPEKNEMIRYLAVMYEPVFGSAAQMLFLFGAFAVLYSTFFVANASLSRVASDAVRTLGFIEPSEKNYRRMVKILCAVLPGLCLISFLADFAPDKVILASGVMQSIVLPMIGSAALFFRYRRFDERLRPHLAWDIFLWVSAGGMLITGVWTAWVKLSPFILSFWPGA